MKVVGHLAAADMKNDSSTGMKGTTMWLVTTRKQVVLRSTDSICLVLDVLGSCRAANRLGSRPAPLRLNRPGVLQSMDSLRTPYLA